METIRQRGSYSKLEGIVQKLISVPGCLELLALNTIRYYVFSREARKKCADAERPLSVILIDFTKTFNIVGRTGPLRKLNIHSYDKGSTYMRELWEMFVPEGKPEAWSVLTYGILRGVVLVAKRFSIGGKWCLDNQSHSTELKQTLSRYKWVRCYLH